jgi:hypothetical protein
MAGMVRDGRKSVCFRRLATDLRIEGVVERGTGDHAHFSQLMLSKV